MRIGLDHGVIVVNAQAFNQSGRVYHNPHTILASWWHDDTDQMHYSIEIVGLNEPYNQSGEINSPGDLWGLIANVGRKIYT